jgi:ribosome-associated protein
MIYGSEMDTAMLGHNDDDYSDYGDEGAFSGPSKSQRKREATALQDLGGKLVNLTSVQLRKMPLPADLMEAIRAAQDMPQRGARKRQLQYIGKLMRRIDASSTAAKRQHHQLETLCAALLEGNEASLTDFFNRHPSADRQQLRQLMRSAALELERGNPPKSRRALFRYLREIVAGSGE